MAEKIKQDGRSIKEIIKTWGGIVPQSVGFDTGIIGIDRNNHVHRRALRQLAVMFHYEGYLSRENDEIRKLKDMEGIRIPVEFDYNVVKGLSNEARAKLIKFRPSTFAQAGRIDGVTPAELTILRVFLKRIGS